MEKLMEFVKPELLVLVPVLYCIGLGLKKSRLIRDHYIPLVLGVCGVLLAGAWVLAMAEITGWQSGLMAAFTAVMQGVLCAGLSVYANQLYKQGQKGENQGL